MEKDFEIVDTSNTEHYIWGNNCDGWHFVNTESLSIIKEKMPPNTEEQLHYHNRAQQFFYILSGMATFEINGVLHHLGENKGICIKPKTRHRILNKGGKDLEFILVSEPKSHADRVNINENDKTH